MNIERSADESGARQLQGWYLILMHLIFEIISYEY